MTTAHCMSVLALCRLSITDACARAVHGSQFSAHTCMYAVTGLTCLQSAERNRQDLQVEPSHVSVTDAHTS